MTTIFGVEKILETRVSGPLFGPGRLNFDVLQTYLCWPAAERFAFGPCDRLIVENYTTYHSLGHRARELRFDGHIIWGSGNGVGTRLAALAAEPTRRPRIHYFGDVDRGGLRIARSAASRQPHGGLPAKNRIACIEMLLSNARSPWEPSSNREEYLLAASNLLAELDDEHRVQFFNAAIDFATNPPISHADALNAPLKNPLSNVRVNDRSDSRPFAAYLAARLAGSSEEKRRARDTGLKLIGIGADDDYRVTRTLQVVQSEIGDSVGLLAQGSWTLRSFAAILWAESNDIPGELGAVLSRDPDVRVRRALARALAREEADVRRSPAREVLMADPRWSVRSVLAEDA